MVVAGGIIINIVIIIIIMVRNPLHKNDPTPPPTPYLGGSFLLFANNEIHM